MSAPQAALQPRPLAQEIEKRLVLRSGLRRRLEHPNLPAAREAAAAFRECFGSLAAHLDLDDALARAVEHDALYGSFEALLAFRSGEPALTASLLLKVWASRALAEVLSGEKLEGEELTLAGTIYQELESLRSPLGETGRTASGTLTDPLDSLAKAARSLAGPGQYTEWLVLFHQAVEQLVAPDLGADQARTALRSLMSRLELSQDDLGRMLGVSGETIRRWERGSTGIPADRRSEILVTESALRRLQDLFRPERLPTVVRRPAELFDGETALEWILRGRIAEVADRYETALLYQA